MMMRFLLFTVLITSHLFGAKLPDLTPHDAMTISQAILEAHASYKNLTPELMKRVLRGYLEELDPTRLYFTEQDIAAWLNPSDEELRILIESVDRSDFSPFVEIEKAMIATIERRKKLEEGLQGADCPKESPFGDKASWAKDDEDLRNRLVWINKEISKALDKLEPPLREKGLLRIEKRRLLNEEEIISLDERFVLTTFLKAFASSLDTHTSYFTPAEASQFMVQVQQRLFGIGVQLRDDLNGFTAVKILEGSPAISSSLKEGDRVIAINGEPTIGMDLSDGVELIRGEEGTVVTLTVLRASEDDLEQELQVEITRGEIVLKDARIESKTVPFADGVIGIIALHGFYQDNSCSSASDLYEEIQKISSKTKLYGVILDLRNNSGGVLPQAVAVSGLFITRGIVVAIKDSSNRIEYLREIRGKAAYEGPLVILVNKASASAAEIVAGTLQDYGRAIVVGDEHTFGKGTFQTFTLDASDGPGKVNPKGEFKVTRGRYYTVSGRSPQLTGIKPDILIPGPFSKAEIGERYAEYPLGSDAIAENFRDDLSDLPSKQRTQINTNTLYRSNLQMRLKTYTQFLPTLRKNAQTRIQTPFYKSFLKEIEEEKVEPETFVLYSKADLQCEEAINVMRDLVCLLNFARLN